MNFKRYMGPSTMVAAAFIGPGTLTVCTVAGANHGYSLLWVLLLTTIFTIFLQEMSARLGLITQQGIGESLRKEIGSTLGKFISIILVLFAVIIGNAAYEAGNITGAALGIEGIAGEDFPIVWMIGILSFCLLYLGKFKWIQNTLIVLVALMGFLFLFTAIAVVPNYKHILTGLLSPTVDTENFWTLLALMGTTIVPYNLFLHAATVSQKWKDPQQLKDLRIENMTAVGFGGIISMAILITSAATIFGNQVTNLNDMSTQLSAILGSGAKYILAAGLFAAGISSSITAPIAAAYAAKGIFGWTGGLKSTKFRITYSIVLIVGTVFATAGYNPIELIKTAQAANALLLPIIVANLLYLCNKKSLLGKYINTKLQNMIAILLLAFCLLISIKTIITVFT